MRDRLFTQVVREHGVDFLIRQAYPEVCLEPVLGPFGRALRAGFCALFGSIMAIARQLLRTSCRRPPSARISLPSVNRYGLDGAIWVVTVPRGAVLKQVVNFKQLV